MKKTFSVLTFSIIFCVNNFAQTQDMKPTEEEMKNTVGENDPKSEVEQVKTEYFQLNGKEVVLPQETYELTKSKLKDFKAYSANVTELNKYSYETPFTIEFDFNLPDRNYHLNLVRNELRSKKYISTQTDGKEQISVKRDLETEEFYQTVTFKGDVNNLHENYSRFAIHDNVLSGYIFIEKENKWMYIQSLNEFLSLIGQKPSSNFDDIILIYDVSSIYENINSCGSTAKKTDDSKEEGGSRGLNCVEYVIEYATEADFEFFQANNGNIQQTNQRIIDWLNLVEGVYSANFNTRFSITQQFVFTQNNDPYTSSAVNILVDQELRFWNTNRNGVDRDIALLFTGRTLDDEAYGSIWADLDDPANINGFGAPCVHPERSYQVTMYRNGAFLTLSHEIGHLFNAYHTDGCNCQRNNNHSCPQTSQPSIMCQGDKNLYFNDWERSSILGHMNAHHNCFEDDVNISPSHSWVKTWTNDNNEHWIGGWYQQDGDQKTIGDFDGDGDDEIVFMSNVYGIPNKAWCKMLEHTCGVGADWRDKWSNNGNRYVNNWYQNSGDRHLSGDFDGDGKSELLSFSNSEKWAMLQGWNTTTNSWYKMFSNGGNHFIGGWYFQKPDQIHIADFDGDGKDEILCISKSGWSKLLKFNGSNFYDIWSNGGNGQIEATPAKASLYTYRSGYFMHTNKKDLINIYGNWYTILSYDPAISKWKWEYSNMGNTNNISGWYIPLGSGDKVLTGNIDNTDKEDELMFFNSNKSYHVWATSMDWTGNGFTQNWNNVGTGSLEDWNLESTNWAMVRADAGFPKQLIGFRRETNGKYYPGGMYRIGDSNKNFKTDNTIEQANMNFKDDKVQIYPNPTTGEVNFISSLSPYSKAQVTVTDLTGRVVVRETFDGFVNRITLNNQPLGMYNIHINENGEISNYKIVLQ